VAAAAEAAQDVQLLINNAGLLASYGVLASPEEALRRDMETNFFGTLAMARAFAPVLERRGGGAMVNFLTVVALAGMPGIGGYCASKAAALSLTQCLRADLGKKGIRVHGVFPGPVDTDMIRSFEMPKTSPAAVAAAVLDGVAAGVDDIFPDPMSRQMHAVWLSDPRAVEKQFAGM
jgi:NAD(P)-dependent dehydrogenase (short-subunit alcohol dehydrogenase family)